MAHRCMLKLGRCGLSCAYRRSTIVKPSIFLPKENSSAFLQKYRFCTQAEAASQSETKLNEKCDRIEKKTHEFKGDTKMLLEIVAKSLYSDKEVFVRELVSNANDALEKLRYTATAEGLEIPEKYGIYISTDKLNRMFSIKDLGIGMTLEELQNNLGTIARSGSRAFLEELAKKGQTGIAESSNIIGQFGVGFYSCFMVADKVEVYTRSFKEGSIGYKWSSDGTGTYDIEECPEAEQGTEIKVYLNVDSREFADESSVQGILKKYSNFVGVPIYVNNNLFNVIQPLWLRNPKDIEPEQHKEFYKFISDSHDAPRFTLQFEIDTPVMIKALLYFPESRPNVFEMSQNLKSGVALYAKRVLIQNKAENILPRWLRFLKGVVDSDDIPLNLSRELLQNSPLIAKLRNVVTGKILSFLAKKLKQDKTEYEKFYAGYGMYLKEGLILSEGTMDKDSIANLLLYEFASTPSEKNTLQSYVDNMKEGENTIYYLSAPSRQLAEGSPYYESMKKKDVDVVFCYEKYDELVLSRLGEYKNRKIVSVESVIRKESKDIGQDETTADFSGLVKFFRSTLKDKVQDVKAAPNLESHPCLITVPEMAYAREFIRSAQVPLDDSLKFSLLQPQLEINLKHPIIIKLAKLTSSDPELAELLAQQLFSNAMVQAGLLEDPRTLVLNMNQLLTRALEKI